MSGQSSEPLSKQRWTHVSVHHVVWAFLVSEWDRFPNKITKKYNSLIFAPSLTDREQNSQRLKILRTRRRAIIKRLPRNTRWFLVKYMCRHHLADLRVINHDSWNSSLDRNELPLVALRKRVILRTTPEDWPPIILFAHDRMGPYTIVEGNHRLTALAGAESVEFTTPVYIGLSEAKSDLHLLDAKSSG